MCRIVKAVAYLDVAEGELAKFDLAWDQECGGYGWDWDSKSAKPNLPPAWEDERFTHFEDAIAEAKRRQWDVFEVSYNRI
jgi:hypothetical protein